MRYTATTQTAGSNRAKMRLSPRLLPGRRAALLAPRGLGTPAAVTALPGPWRRTRPLGPRPGREPCFRHRSSYVAPRSARGGARFPCGPHPSPPLNAIRDLTIMKCEDERAVRHVAHEPSVWSADTLDDGAFYSSHEGLAARLSAVERGSLRSIGQGDSRSERFVMLRFYLTMAAAALAGASAIVLLDVLD